ncbi:ABC transporter ATP-binding protein [Herbaspirillum autotrophicum]|uniref:ABC transporter ATP-binding protein n=1 Tax=Herbaspirillum autotrophicum TaxID=180195 RepID=UPI000A8E960F|nr:ABC transporter ATP-binding protein [Herbaspirillum autotrophicum]
MFNVFICIVPAMLLEIDNLHAYYGQSHVLHGVSLRVDAGEIVSVLGRNGVGRSTLLKAIMGQLQTEGSIRFRNEPMAGLKTFDIARRGIAYVPESRDVFPGLTVAQNLLLGQQRRRSHQPAAWTAADMYRMFPQLEKRRAVAAGLLSGGEQQMLSLSRSLMGNPDLILIDEPTEGLSPQMVELVAGYLQALRGRGIAVLLIEQKQTIALDISQRLYVMGHGAVVFDGTPQQLQENRALRSEWLEI